MCETENKVIGMLEKICCEVERTHISTKHWHPHGNNPCPSFSRSFPVLLFGRVYAKKNIEDKIITEAKAFDLTVKYNDDVFVNHKTKFCLLNSINILHEQTKLPSALFLVLYLKFNTNGHRSTKLLEKRDNFNFAFLNYP